MGKMHLKLRRRNLKTRKDNDYVCEAIYSDWLYARISESSGLENELSQPQLSDRPQQNSSGSAYGQIYSAKLMADGRLKLEQCLAENPEQTDFSKHCFRIVGIERVDSQQFTLNIVGSGDPGEPQRQLLCYHPYADKTDKWIEHIRPIIQDDVRHLRVTDHFQPIFCFTFQLVFCEKMVNHLQNFPVSQEMKEPNVYKVLINQNMITLHSVRNVEDRCTFPLSDISVMKNAPVGVDQNDSVLFTLYCGGRGVVCKPVDELQCHIFIILVELWSRSTQLSRPRSKDTKTSLAETRFTGGFLHVGTTPTTLHKTLVRVIRGSKTLECIDLSGRLERFEVHRSQVTKVNLHDKNFICHVVARQILPTYVKNDMVEFYIGLPTREALEKWNRQFTVSPSTALSCIDVILGEMGSRDCGWLAASTDASISRYLSDLNKLHECFALLELPQEHLSRTLNDVAEWPSVRLVYFLFFLLTHLSNPILTSHIQRAMSKLMSQTWFEPDRKSLPMDIAHTLSQLSTFQLCVLTRLAIYFISEQFVRLTESTTLAPVERLSVMTAYWKPLTQALCGIRVDRQNIQAIGVTYFLSAYQYLLQTMLVKQCSSTYTEISQTSDALSLLSTSTNPLAFWLKDT
ncbi:hypothetical protein CRM22_004409 [Opisthorchis felineus]|uniref:Uncharacterized protein n=1 Tax=Opisthorchis felineus TaxID=147828 RepID=A0A4S2LWD9_OPIFE|nr:hypothetical protein CRM22_004409 [Opisthorchis felineus]